jgi:exodeoxyribonuclease V beta subunit
MDRQALRVFETPLTGISLIEASAGTGKTHTITDLYVRLIIETECQVSQILVVTFTVAATAELRDRIRRRLLTAHQACSGQRVADTFCEQLLMAYPQPDQALQRLDHALRGFDEAAIYTIHGFCERVLTDRAFESGMPFVSELLTDERELLQEVVDDFWRRTVYDASPLFVRYLLDSGGSPEQLLGIIHPYIGRPYLQVVPSEYTGEQSTVQIEAAFAEAYRDVRALWQTAATEVEEILSTSEALNRNRYRLSSIPTWINEMATYLALETPAPGLFDTFDRFTARRLATALKRGHQSPQHPFFTACDRLGAAHEQLDSAYTQRCYALKVTLWEFCQQELRRRKRRRQAVSYDDLLLNLEEALQRPQGHELAAALRHRYPVALIDEFQDTDPVQYRIFRQIYQGTTAPVFFVGDPKQAIYSFRGADIFAYLRACRDVDRHYTLDVNWRSDPGLIQAVNTLFASVHRPFLFDDIMFHPVQPAPQQAEALHEQDCQVSQLRLWFLEGRDGGGRINKTEATFLAAQATAGEIARLLTLGAHGAAQVGSRALSGGDIAVLVRTHREGRVVRDALLRQRVASVQLGQDNVFNSWEAMELERVLQAVANPGSESLLRGALATVMLGHTGEQIYAMSEDEQLWEDRVAAFYDYHYLWRDRGFAALLRTLLSQEHVAPRLLGFQDGERRLTNLLHLAELLQAAADRQRTGMEGLLKWLEERRQTEASEDEEEQLRLESDEHLVKIVTIHKSKGLEYPIVFCPFLWSGGLWSLQEPTLSFHHPDEEYQPALDLGSSRLDASRVYACHEEAAENLRLLYVALTRARHCCYIVWGAVRDIETAPLAWLLHQPTLGDDCLSMATLEAYVKTRSEADLRADIERYAARANGSVRIAPLPNDAGEPYRPPPQPERPLAARSFPGLLQSRWQITSFSSLVTGTGAELPDHDALTPLTVLEPQMPEQRTRFTFPRGVRAGTCFHAMFERLDFTQSERGTLDPVVEQCLAEYGFEAEWTPVVADMVQRVLTAPLDTAQSLSLQQVSCARRLNEMAFYYPVGDLTDEGLRRLLSAHDFAIGPIRQEIERLAFAPTRGYMKGFIDLVFEANGRYYLADYKSNWLGNTIEAYRVEALQQVMAQEMYYLQYVIYTLAVHRYLRLRLPEYDYDIHFGGVFYLFLRGMDPQFPTYGVFHDRPAQPLIAALDAYLSPGAAGS